MTSNVLIIFSEHAKPRVASLGSHMEIYGEVGIATRG